MRFTLTTGRVQLHVRTCVPLFRIPEMTGRIASNFGMWVEGFTERIMLKHGMLLIH